MTKIGGRKFLAFLLAFSTLAGALFAGFIEGSEFISGLGVVYLTYVGGNVSQKKFIGDT